VTGKLVLDPDDLGWASLQGVGEIVGEFAGAAESRKHDDQVLRVELALLSSEDDVDAVDGAYLFVHGACRS